MIKNSSLVTPGPVPFHLTPRVPETHQTDFGLLLLRCFALRSDTNRSYCVTYSAVMENKCSISDHQHVHISQIYLLHGRHRVGVTLHQSRRGTSLEASGNQRLQDTKCMLHTFRKKQGANIRRLFSDDLTSMEHPMREPRATAFFMML